MKRSVLVASLIFAILAFACGAGGTTLTLTITQPAIASSTVKVPFAIAKGDSANDIGDRLQKQGLIRNATFFKLLARLRSLDSKLRPGTYTLSPSMSMDKIIQTLLAGVPDPGVTITFAPGFRVTEYPTPRDSKGHRYDLKTKLPNFNKENFLKIAKTGKWLDGKDIAKDYWFVPPPQKNAVYALEGYLYPDTYTFNSSDDETAVIKTLLNYFGLAICPDPGGAPDETSFFWKKETCLAHQAIVDDTTKVKLFDAVTKMYFEKDETLALYKALTISSLTIREIANHDDSPGVAGVYYNRYLEAVGKLPSPPYDWVPSMGSDPTAQYARDTDKPPDDPKDWWKDLAPYAGKDVSPDNPYNTDNVYHRGLPPGPIAAPTSAEIKAAANPTLKPVYLYFISDGCQEPKMHYSRNLAEFQYNNAKYLDKCPG